MTGTDQTAPDWRDKAWTAFRQFPGTRRGALMAALDDAAPHLMRDGYMEGTAAERDRCVLLAESCEAVYQDENGDTRSFADLLGGDQK